MSPDSLNNLEIQRYYQNETKFNGVYSKIIYQISWRKDHIVDLDKYTLNSYELIW